MRRAIAKPVWSGYGKNHIQIVPSIGAIFWRLDTPMKRA
jgi:hypothetical protein